MQELVAGIGLDPSKFGAHSLRRTKAVLIYRRTGNLRANQLLPGHGKIETTARYLGIEVDDAIELAKKIDTKSLDALSSIADMVRDEEIATDLKSTDVGFWDSSTVSAAFAAS